MESFNKLTNYFCSTGEIGHIHKDDYSIVLYDMENSKEKLSDLESRINKTLGVENNNDNEYYIVEVDSSTTKFSDIKIIVKI